ncbi:MAG: alpha/beta hydrolase [Acidobacteriota bacterium]
MKTIVRFLAALLLLLLLGAASLYRPDLSPTELEARYTDAASHFAELESLRVHFKDEGAGPPLLLIHGTASSLHTWDGWVAELRDRFRLVRLDLPGFGLTGPDPAHDYSAERRVEILKGLLDHLGIDRCSVAGNSLGGYLAWQLAARHPETVDRMVLIDAAGYPRQRQEGTTVMDLGRVPVLRDVLSRLTPRLLIAAAVRESYGDPTKATPQIIDRYYELLLRRGNRQSFLIGLNSEREDEYHLIRTLEQPTLVMWGSEDALIAVDAAKRFHQDLPHSELLIYPDIGHVPMEEIPERSARDAAAFLLGEVEGAQGETKVP